MSIGRSLMSRRSFLRCSTGGLGTLVALPALEIMFKTDTAYAQASSGPPRFLAIYQPNGHDAGAFAPNAPGGIARAPSLAGYSTAPLAPHMDVTTIFKNFNSSKAGGSGNDHLRAITSWLRGTHTIDDSDTTMRRFTVSPTNRSSADVHIARTYEQLHPLPSGRSQHLVLRGSAFYDGAIVGYNNRQKQWLSTATDGSRIDAEFDLYRVYDRLFAGLDPTVSADQAAARLALKKSVIDFVLPDVHALERRLGASDKRTLESYFQNVRGLEERLQAQVASGGASTSISVPAKADMIRHKGESDATGGWFVDDNYNGRGHNHIDYHWRDTTRLLTVAFQADLVRSVAYMLESEAGENNYVEGPGGEAGLGDNHAASHALNEGYRRRDFRHAQAYAEMISALKDNKAGGEPLIDNTLVVWGAGIGVTHSDDRVMAVVSGLGRAGIKHNAVRDMKNASQKPLMQTLLRKMGVLGSDQTFGEGNSTAAEVDVAS